MKNKIYIAADDTKKEMGGTSYSTLSLLKLLSKKYDTKLICFDYDNDNNTKDLKVISFKNSSKIFFIRFVKFYKYLKSVINKNDYLHVQSLWRFHSIVPFILKKKLKFNLIYSPRGTLDKYALSFSKFKKQIFYNLFLQKKSLELADYFHATSEKEYKEIREMGFSQPIAIIPNPIQKTTMKENKKRNVISFVGRIHPIKGLDNLLAAWKEVYHIMKYDLKIYGVWENKNYVDKLQNYIKKNKIKRVKIYGSIYGEEKNKLYQTSSFTIFPSFTENFGNSIGESLMNGTPVLVSDKTPWENVQNLKCGFIFNNSIGSIKDVLIEINKIKKSEIENYSINSRNYALKTFSKDIVEDSFYNFYSWINNKENQPNFIKIN